MQIGLVGGLAQGVKHLPTMFNALGSIPSMLEKKKKDKIM
jgi:hypothetical protein